MSRINELIEELCPDGVPFRALGDIAELQRGQGMPRAMLVSEGVGAVHYGDIYTQYGHATRHTINFISPGDAERLVKVFPGDVIVTNTSENIEDVCSSLAWLGEDSIVTGGHSTVIRSQMDASFVSYWFRSSEFAKLKRKLATGTKVIEITANSLKKVRIPVPPIEVQREIVRILDQFTQLEAELEAELERRRLQFETVRKAVLTRGLTSCETLRLGDIATVKTGSVVSKSMIRENPGEYPVINSGREPLGFISRYNTVDDPLGVTSRGAGVGSITWCEGKYFRGGLNYSVSINDETHCLPRFLYYVLLDSEVKIKRLCSYDGIPALNKVNLERLEVCVPSLPVQFEVISLLDNLEKLIKGLDFGLPAEIAARRKQYEYYRDKLLTFKELPA